MSGVAGDLPQYRQDSDYTNQEGYQQLFNLILTQWFSSNGFFQPSLTNAQITALLAMTPTIPTGTHWYNSDLDKMQFMTAGGVETVTSV